MIRWFLVVDVSCCNGENNRFFGFVQEIIGILTSMFVVDKIFPGVVSSLQFVRDEILERNCYYCPG